MIIVVGVGVVVGVVLEFGVGVRVVVVEVVGVGGGVGTTMDVGAAGALAGCVRNGLKVKLPRLERSRGHSLRSSGQCLLHQLFPTSY